MYDGELNRRVGPRKDIVVAMDWTDYDADGQATLALKLVTRHGRATPLVWLSVLKDELADARNAYEDAAVRRLVEVLPAGVKCTILADRGFADTKLFGFLAELGFDYVIRLKGNTKVSAADGTTRPNGRTAGRAGPGSILFCAAQHQKGRTASVGVSGCNAQRMARSQPLYEACPAPQYKVGDEVLRRGRAGIRQGRIVEVLNVVAGKPVAYQVRIGMVTYLEEELNLRPALRRTA